MQITGIILIVMAILGKVGAVLCTIPEPIIGGLSTVSLGAVFGEYTYADWLEKKDAEYFSYFAFDLFCNYHPESAF